MGLVHQLENVKLDIIEN